MDQILKTTFKLRRGQLAEWESIDPILSDGEPGFAIDTGGLKIGDGVKKWTELDYINGSSVSGSVQVGYYFNGKFYTDSTYQTELPKVTTCVYINRCSGSLFYAYDGTKYVPAAPEATDEIPGLVKLYSTHGENEDGTMTQKSITEGVNSIKFAIEKIDSNNDGKLTDEDENCLVLDLPWD